MKPAMERAVGLLDRKTFYLHGGDPIDHRNLAGQMIAAVDAKDEALKIRKTMRGLGLRERTVVEMRYGLNGGSALKLREIGEFYGCSKERVRQIEVGALRKLQWLLTRERQRPARAPIPKQQRPLRIDRTGKRFGKLVAMTPERKIGLPTHWKCACDCGNIVVVSGSNLGNGNTRSCGCLSAELQRAKISAAQEWRYRWAPVPRAIRPPTPTVYNFAMPWCCSCGGPCRESTVLP